MKSGTTISCPIDVWADAIAMDIDGRTEPAPGLFRNEPGVPVSAARMREDFGVFGQGGVSLADLTLDLPAKLSDIVAKLRLYGVVILPGLLQGEALEGLRRDFTHLVEHHASLATQFKIDLDDSNVCLRLPRDKLAGSGLAGEIERFYSSPILAAIAERYLGHAQFALNKQIFVHETRPTDDPLSGPLHFDVSRMLKFWVYLDDDTREAGAMRVAAGSNLFLSKIREEFSGRSIPKEDICNIVDESQHPAVVMEAPAGSLMIFDTDAAHGAGRVAPGQVRRIIRGNTMETKYIERSNLRMGREI